jgi:hypothetical protein
VKPLSGRVVFQIAPFELPSLTGAGRVDEEFEIRLRRITEPTAEQKSLLHQLQLSLPDRLKSLSKCSADLKTT